MAPDIVPIAARDVRTTSHARSGLASTPALGKAAIRRSALRPDRVRRGPRAQCQSRHRAQDKTPDGWGTLSRERRAGQGVDRSWWDRRRQSVAIGPGTQR